MISAVIVSGLLVTVVAAMLLAINARGDRIGRQHDYYAARAMGAGAAGFLYAHLHDDAGFFTDMMAASDPNATPPLPTTYDWIAWLDATATTEPDTATDSDWRRFEDAGAGELTQVQCDSSSPPCWVLRFKADPATTGSTPTTVVAEAIVRYDCRFGTYCSVLRFQQRLATYLWSTSGACFNNTTQIINQTHTTESNCTGAGSHTWYTSYCYSGTGASTTRISAFASEDTCHVWTRRDLTQVTEANKLT